jgi:hypothetical protein
VRIQELVVTFLSCMFDNWFIIIFHPGTQFGETFTYLQYTHIISIIDSYSTRVNSKNCLILCNHIALLEKVSMYLSVLFQLTDVLTTAGFPACTANIGGKSCFGVRVRVYKHS